MISFMAALKAGFPGRPQVIDPVQMVILFPEQLHWAQDHHKQPTAMIKQLTGCATSEK